MNIIHERRKEGEERGGQGEREGDSLFFSLSSNT